LLDRLETRTGQAGTLTGRLLDVPTLLDDHPADLVGVAGELRTLYFDAAWWDLTAEAGRRILRAHVPHWAVKLAVGNTPWPAGDPYDADGQAVLALDHGEWKDTSVVRATPSHAEWRYELKLRAASWDEAKLAPYFAQGTEVHSILLPQGRAEVR